MGNKYVPSVKDQKAQQRFRDNERRKQLPAAPKAAAAPKTKKK